MNEAHRNILVPPGILGEKASLRHCGEASDSKVVPWRGYGSHFFSHCQNDPTHISTVFPSKCRYIFTAETPL